MLNRLFNVLRAIKLFMLSNPKSVSELEHEYWLTNLVFSMDLRAHLNELNRHPQCETQCNASNHNSSANEAETMETSIYGT